MEQQERNYVAFISYRHLPLDMTVAEELHKLIERYRIPKDLRTEGETSLGLVFRDRDELPLSSNLTEDIYSALDRAEFLIVICTPDTPKSVWVEREIAYFIEHKGRDRILVVHAAGKAEEAIPHLITHVYDQNGVLVDRVEPLSAYLVDSSQQRILSNLRREFLRLAAVMLDCPYDMLVRQQEFSRPRHALKREFLRLIAAILGCPYDALIQRNKRYLYQRLMAFFLAAAMVLLVFSGVVLNKNAKITHMNTELSDKNQQIHQLLQQSLLSESQALATLSSQQLKEGNRLAAVRSALAALPDSQNDRPYCPEAVFALSEAIAPYAEDHQLTSLSKMSFSSTIIDMAISNDTRHVVTLDQYDLLQCYDIKTDQVLWSIHHNEDPLTPEEDAEQSVLPAKSRIHFLYLTFSQDGRYVIHVTTQAVCVLSTATGEHLYSLHYPRTLSVTLSPDDRYLAIYHEEGFFTFHDLATGQQVSKTEPLPFLGYPYTSIEAAGFSCDSASFLAWGCDSQSYINMTDSILHRFQIDPASGNLISSISEEAEGSYDFIYVSPLESGKFLSFIGKYGAYQEDTRMICQDSDGNVLYDKAHDFQLPLTIGEDLFWYTATDEYTVCGATQYGKTTLFFFRTGDGTLLSSIDATEFVSAHLDPENTLMLFFSDGLVQRYAINGEDGALSLLSELETGDPIASVFLPQNRAPVFCLVPSWYDSSLEARFLTLTESLSCQKLPLDYIASVTMSPSGHYMIVSASRETLLINTKTRESTVLSVPTRDYAGFAGFSADETKLLFECGTVYHIPTGEITYAELWCELPVVTQDYHTTVTTAGDDIAYNEVSYGLYRTLNQKAGEPLVSAVYHQGKIHWWLDDIHYESSPCPYEDFVKAFKETTNVILGENGLILLRVPAGMVWSIDHETGSSQTSAYILYSIEDDSWHYLDYPFVPGAVNGNIPTASKKWIACMDNKNTFSLYDPINGAVVSQFSIPVPAKAVVNIQFLLDDSVMLLLTDSDICYVLDTATGKLLMDPIDLVFNYSLELFIDAEKQQLILYGSQYGPGFVIDMQNWTILYRVPHLLCYSPAEDRYIILREDGTTVSCPVYSVAELMDIGNAMISSQ